MRLFSNQGIFIFLVILSIILIYLLAPILTPFLLAALLAYLVDPLVKRLEKFHIPHLLSVILIFATLFTGVVILALTLYPLIAEQVEILITTIPSMVDWVQSVGMPWVKQYINVETLKTSIPATISKSGWVFDTILKSGFTVIQIGITLVLTPIVTFYLLRDWDRIINA